MLRHEYRFGPFPGPPSPEALERHISRASKALLASQREDGHWCFELEADATIPSEYVLLRHFRGEQPDLELERLIAVYLRRIQGAHGGWPIFHAGAFDISASVKAYFALKMIGDDPEAPHMRRAREAILAHGGAAKSNVFTRFLLALYGAIPWRGVPTMPVEIMLLPRWFPFHLDKVSYWARTVLVPLLVLQALKPRAANPRGVTIAELFTAPPETVRKWPTGAHQAWAGVKFFGAVDWLLKRAEPLFPASLRRRAIDAAAAFVTERLNGEDGLGGIYPAMANAVLMFDALGYPPDHPHLVAARQSIERLLVIKRRRGLLPALPVAGLGHRARRPCADGSWRRRRSRAGKGGARLAKPLQVLDVKGDWAARRPDVRPGGWAFQYANPHYPDLDDTAVVAMAMDRADRGGLSAAPNAHAPAIARAREWIEGLQSRNGAWAAFDADNTYHYLNHIPFADHGALLDPPTADVTARCVSLLAQLGETRETSAVLARGIDALLKDQEEDGSWFGRWGMNYIYGTWSALCALAVVGLDSRSEPVRQGRRVARPHPERRRRLGRERRQLQARLQRVRAGAQHRLADGLGGARAHGGGRGGLPRRRPRRRLSRRDPRRRRILERAVPHRDRIPARVLLALPRLFEVFSAVGARPLSQSQARQQPRRDIRHVTALITRAPESRLIGVNRSGP